MSDEWKRRNDTTASWLTNAVDRRRGRPPRKTPFRRKRGSDSPDRLTQIINVGRTEVANPCRSCANQIAFKRTLRAENRCDMRPKFRHSKGLLDTAYKSPGSDSPDRLADAHQDSCQDHEDYGDDNPDDPDDDPVKAGNTHALDKTGGQHAGNNP